MNGAINTQEIIFKKMRIPSEISNIAMNDKILAIASNQDNIIRIVDINAEILLSTLKAHKEEIQSLVMNSNFIISNTAKEIKIWDINLQKCIKTIQKTLEQNHLFDMNEDFVYIANKNNIEIWDINLEKCIEQFQASKTPIVSISANKDFIAIVDSESIKILDIKSKKCVNSKILTLDSYNSPVLEPLVSKSVIGKSESTKHICISLTQEHLIVAKNQIERLVFDLKTLEYLYNIREICDCNKFTTNNNFIALVSSLGTEILILDAKTNKITKKIKNDLTMLQIFAINDKYIAIEYPDKIKIFNTTTKEHITTISIFDEFFIGLNLGFSIFTMLFLDNDQLFIKYGYLGIVIKYDIITKEYQKIDIDDFENEFEDDFEDSEKISLTDIEHLAISSQHIVIIDSDYVMKFYTLSGINSERIELTNDYISSLCLNDDYVIITGSDNGNECMQIYDIYSGEQEKNIKIYSNIKSLAADENFIYSLDEEGIKIWDILTAKCIKSFKNNTNTIDSILVNSNNIFLATSDNIMVFDMDGDFLETLVALEKNIISFDENGYITKGINFKKYFMKPLVNPLRVEEILEEESLTRYFCKELSKK